MTGDGVAQVAQLPVARLCVDDANPRREPGDVTELAASVGTDGIHTPLVVRERPDGWGVLSGSRRLAAARQVGLDAVPCLVRQLTDTEAALLAVAENVGRSQLDPMDEARAYEVLVSGHKLTNKAVADRVGVSQGHVSKRRALLKLPTEKQQQVSSGQLSVDRAYAEACRQPKPDPPNHGTRNRYAAGCKCAKCKGANAERARRRRNESTEAVHVPRELVDRTMEQAGVPRQGVGQFTAEALKAKLAEGDGDAPSEGAGGGVSASGHNGHNGHSPDGNGKAPEHSHNGVNGANGTPGATEGEGANGHQPSPNGELSRTPPGKTPLLVADSDVARIREAAQLRGVNPAKWLHEAIFHKWALEGPAKPQSKSNDPTSVATPTTATGGQP